MKKQCKEKFKDQLEQVEVLNAENVVQRVAQAEATQKELHKKDLEVQAQKFESRLRAYFLEISEHESIMRQFQVQEREKQQILFNNLQAEKQTQIA